MTGTHVPLVGRDRERQVLAAGLDRVRGGRPRAVLVAGEAGVGKTVLVDAVLEDASDALVLRARGEPAETSLEFGVLDQLAARARRRSVPGSRTPLTFRSPIEAGEWLLDVLASRSRRAPVVISVDDVQWADRASVLALVFAMRRLREERVLLVMTARLGDGPGPPEALVRLCSEPYGEHLRLTGLAVPDLARLLELHAPGEVRLSVAKRIGEHTRGNPLWATALVAELPPTVLQGGTDALPAPRPFTQMMRNRLAGCTDDTRRVVATVAVLGGRPAGVDVAAVAGVADLLAAVDEAVAAGLIRRAGQGPGITVDFTHPLVAAAVLESVPLAELAALHRCAAATASDEAERLRHELIAAAGPDPELAQRAVRRAWEQAARGELVPAAASFLAAAPVCAANDRDAVLLDAAEVALTGGDVAAAATALSRRSGGADGARAKYLVGWLAFTQGRFPPARESLTQAWETAGVAEIGVRAGSALCLGHLELTAGRYETAVAWAERARDDDPHGVLGGTATGLRGAALALAGRAEEGLAGLEWVAHDGDLLPQEVHAAGVRGYVLVYLDRFDEARDVLTRCVAAAKRLGHYHLISPAVCHLAELEHRVGAWDVALERAETAIAYTDDFDHGWAVACAFAMAAVVPARQGDWATAECRVRRAIEAAGRLADEISIAYAATSAVQLAHARGDHEAVLRAAEPLLPIAPRHREPGILQWPELYAEALVRTGRVAEAEAVVRDVNARAAARGRLSGMSSAARARGLLLSVTGDVDGASASFAAAIEHGEAVGMPFEVALAHALLGEHLRRQERRRAAGQHLDVAAELFTRLAAEPYLARVHRELEACRRPGRPGRPRVPQAVMTPQEAAVARLVAQGLSNRDVAEQLVVTVKTVEFHLGNLYRKLGVRSRTQLTRALLVEASG